MLPTVYSLICSVLSDFIWAALSVVMMIVHAQKRKKQYHFLAFFIHGTFYIFNVFKKYNVFIKNVGKIAYT